VLELGKSVLQGKNQVYCCGMQVLPFYDLIMIAALLEIGCFAI
jgi:hypothetical protein